MQLGKYEIIEELGRGGFGTVYKAHDTVLDVDRALKVLHPALVSDVTFLERFKQEARLAAKLNHINIVPVYDYGEIDGRFFLVMKYMPGGSLKNLLEREGKLNQARAMGILAQVGRGIAYAHSLGVIHRDLKPGNILFEDDAHIAVSDFGFARTAIKNSASLSTSGGLLGTPAYIAPEIWWGKIAVPQTDIYSMGCIYCEMISGRILFDGDSPAEVMTRHVINHPALPEEIKGEQVPIVNRSLAVDPQDRFQQVEQFISALEGNSNREDLIHEAPGSLPQKPNPQKKTFITMTGITLFIGLITILIGLFGGQLLGLLKPGTVPTTQAAPTALPAASIDQPTLMAVNSPTGALTLIPGHTFAVIEYVNGEAHFLHTNGRESLLTGLDNYILNESGTITTGEGVIQIALSPEVVLLLDKFTQLELLYPDTSFDSASAGKLTLLYGRMLVHLNTNGVEDLVVHVLSGAKARVSGSIMGLVFLPGEDNYFQVDCIEGHCSQLDEDETASLSLGAGQSGIIANQQPPMLKAENLVIADWQELVMNASYNFDWMTDAAGGLTVTPTPVENTNLPASIASSTKKVNPSITPTQTTTPTRSTIFTNTPTPTPTLTPPTPIIITKTFTSTPTSTPSGGTCNGYTITILPEGAGSVQLSPAPNCPGGYLQGTVVTASYSTNTGYMFQQWMTSGCTPSSSTCSLTVTQHTYWNINFYTCQELRLSVSPDGSYGSISVQPPPDCGSLYNPNTAITLLANPAPGKVFLYWDEGYPKENPRVVHAQSNLSYRAMFGSQ